MHRPHSAAFAASRSVGFRTERRRAFTLVEVLIATVLTLIVMGALVKFFGDVNKTINVSRAGMEMSSQLRAAQNRCQRDLSNATAVLNPPLRPEQELGYFEIIEGPWPRAGGFYDAVGDTTLGDVDDILMLTTYSPDEPFVGRFNGGTLTSRVAEVAWFVRGRTLYRRQLLVLPSATGLPNGYGFYEKFDLSVHQEGGDGDPRVNAGGARLVPNTLGDLTKRENRYAHEPLRLNGFPHDARKWGRLIDNPSSNTTIRHGVLGLPTLYESSFYDGTQQWPLPYYKDESGVWKATEQLPVLMLSSNEPFDAWQRPHPYVDNNGVPLQNQITGNLAVTSSSRVAEDVILNNVLSFDVKVWDPTAPVILARYDGSAWVPVNPASPTTDSRPFMPGDAAYTPALVKAWATNMTTSPAYSYGAYVDLNYLNDQGNYPNFTPGPVSTFSWPGNTKSGLSGNDTLGAVYDTWSTHYESDGISQDGDNLVDEGTDGIDNDASNPGAPGYGIIDDADELETSPPYAVPLRGLQIQIRVFEPDSGQIRQVTIVQEFMPE